jgi:hypothetical protein
MTDHEKALAEKDKRIADLEQQLQDATATEVEADEDLTPTPTQAELDRTKSGEAPAKGGYKTRQSKAN